MTNAYPYPRYCAIAWYEYECCTLLTEISGAGTEALQYSQKFRALWHRCTELTVRVGIIMLGTYPVYCARPYRSYRSSGYGDEFCTDLTEVSGTGISLNRAELTEFVCRLIPGKYPGYGSVHTLQNTTLENTMEVVEVCMDAFKAVTFRGFQEMEASQALIGSSTEASEEPYLLPLARSTSVDFYLRTSMCFVMYFYLLPSIVCFHWLPTTSNFCVYS